MEDENLFLREIGIDPMFVKEAASGRASSYDALFESPITPTGYTGIGTSMYDENVPYMQLAELNEARARRQPNWVKAGAGLARVGAKVVSEIAKMPGVLGGSLMAPFAEEGEGWETAVNNAWIKNVDEWAKDINEDILPVYVKKAVSEGNLLDNIFSVDFWATEGADGIGFIASMFAPGAALKSLNFGTRAFQGIKAVGKLGGMGKKLDDAAQLLSKAGLSPKSLELGTQTVANTLIEAAAEAKGAGDAYMARIQEDLNNGIITEETAKVRKAELMRNVFVSNTAILLGPNAVMTKMLWGTNAGKKATKFMKKGAIDEPAKLSRLDKLGKFGKAAAVGAPREGLWEEGMQSTVENFFTERAVEGGGDLFDTQGNYLLQTQKLGSALVESYIETMSEVEGQKAAFLGAFLGGGMSGVHGVIAATSEEKRTKTIVDKLKNLESFHRLFTDDVYDADGKLNNTKVLQKLEALSTSEGLSTIFNNAIETNDIRTIDDLRAFASGELIKSFLIDDVGLDALNQYLNEATTVEDMSKQEKRKIQDIINPIKDRAAKLKKDNDLFDAYGPAFMSMPTEEGIKQVDKDLFLDSKRSEYLTKKNFQYYVADRLDSEKKLRDGLLESVGLERGLQTGDELLEKAKKDNFALTISDDLVKDLEKQSKVLRKDINDFWNPEDAKQSLENLKTVREAFEKSEAEKDELAVLKSEIEKANTIEEVDKVGNATSEFGKKSIKEYKDERKRVIKNREEAARKQQIKDQEERSQKTTEKNSAKEEIIEEVSEKIDESDIGEASEIDYDFLTAAGIPERTDLLGEGIFLAGQEGDTFIFQSYGGEQFRVTKTTKEEKEPEAVDNSQTEGSENHDELAENIEKSVSVTVEGTKSDSKLISTNEETGEKFSFVSDEYMEAEREPSDKRGRKVGIKVGEAIPESKTKLFTITQGVFTKLLSNPKLSNLTKKELNYLQRYKDQANALKIKLTNKALEIYNKEGVTEKNAPFLIEFLSLKGMLSDNVGAPLFTKPMVINKDIVDNKDGTFTISAEEVFNKSSRILRVNIINALVQGSKIEDINGTVVGQYGGRITRAPLMNGVIPENDINDLHHLQSMSKGKRMQYIQDNIGFINTQGQIELKDGSTFTMTTLREKSKGEVYLLLPSANGTRTPVKLNIKRVVDENKVNLLADIIEKRFKDRDVNKSTSLAELGKDSIVAQIKSTFAEELKLIGKPVKDVTLKDIIDFIIYDNTTNVKTQVRFKGSGVKGGSLVFLYGNPATTGKASLTSGEFDKDHFKNWLRTEKRHNITLKANDRNKASIFDNIKYLEYLIDSKTLNTNAVVGKDSNGRPNPTFQGRTDIYLSSNIKNNIGEKEKIAEIEKGTTKASTKLILTDIVAKLKELTDNGNNWDTIAKISKITGNAYANEKILAVDYIRAKEDETNPYNAEFIKVVEKYLNSQKEEIKKEVENKTKDNLKKSKKTTQKIRKSGKEFVSSYEVPNTEEAAEVEKTKKENTRTDNVDISNKELMSIIKELRGRKLIKGGSVVAKAIQNKSLSNKQKLEKMREVLGENTMTEVIKKCNG